MVSIKFVAVTAFLLIQGIQSYCIYNDFTDKLGFSIEQIYSGAPLKKQFSQVMNPGETSCCHFTNKHCSYNQVNNEEAKFSVTLLREVLGDRPTLTPSCTTGGVLIIGGTVNNYFAECIDARGNRFSALGSADN